MVRLYGSQYAGVRIGLLLLASCCISGLHALTCSNLFIPGAPVLVDLPSLIGCLQAIPVNTTYNTELAEAAVLGAKLHVMTPYIPTAYSAVMALVNDTNLTQFEFLSKAAQAYGAAQDLHFIMHGPPFYDQVYKMRVIGFGIQMVNGSIPEVYVASILSSNYNQYYSMWVDSGTTATFPSLSDIEATALKTVVSINGMPAMEWMRQQSLLEGLSTDSANLNLAITNNFFTRLLDDPDVSATTELIEFSDGTSFSYPAMAYVGNTANGETYRCDISYPSNSPLINSRRRRRQQQQSDVARARWPQTLGLARRRGDRRRELGAHMLDVQRLQSTPTADSTTVTNVANVPGLGTASVQVIGNVTVAVLQLSTFETYLGDPTVLINDLVGPLVEAASGVTTELVIDVSYNGGGYVLLGYVLLQLLDYEYAMTWFQETNGEYLLLNPDVKSSWWYESFIRDSVFNGPFVNFWYNDLNNTFFGNTTPLPPYPPRGSSGSPPWWYSAGANDYYTPQFQQFFGLAVNQHSPPFNRIRVLSDGVCLSTCCDFVNKLASFGISGGTVELVGFGGFVGDPSLQMAASCGGSVHNTSCANSIAGLSQPPFLTGTTQSEDITFGFVSRAILQYGTSTVPWQYSTQAVAQVQFYNWDAIGPSASAQALRLQLLYPSTSSAWNPLSSHRGFLVALALALTAVGL